MCVAPLLLNDNSIFLRKSYKELFLLNPAISQVDEITPYPDHVILLTDLTAIDFHTRIER